MINEACFLEVFERSVMTDDFLLKRLAQMIDLFFLLDVLADFIMVPIINVHE
jgi:hypothetical protein